MQPAMQTVSYVFRQSSDKLQQQDRMLAKYFKHQFIPERFGAQGSRRNEPKEVFHIRIKSGILFMVMLITLKPQIL
jgi:hypothetical protein